MEKYISAEDFVLLADYVQPAWVKETVFYQIFPERFCNGNPGNDVKIQYSIDGHSTIHMKNWKDKALTYKEGFCLDFYGGDLQSRNFCSQKMAETAI